MGEHQPNFYGTEPAKLVIIHRPQVAYQINVYDDNTAHRKAGHYQSSPADQAYQGYNLLLERSRT
jgi:hypothetical protein